MVDVLKKKRTLKTIGNVFFWIILVLVIVYSVTALFSDEESNMRSIFGINAMSVQSDSMSPTFVKGDLIFVNKNVTFGEDLLDKVITYRQMVQTTTGETVMIFNSHRVIGVTETNGSYWFTTKGDNEAPDPSPVFQSDVVGVWTGARLPGFGNFSDSFLGFLKSSLGFFLFIVLPCFLFLVYEIYKFVRVMSEYNVEKAVGDKDKLREEALAQAKAQIEAELRKEMEEKLKAQQ